MLVGVVCYITQEGGVAGGSRWTALVDRVRKLTALSHVYESISFIHEVGLKLGSLWSDKHPTIGGRTPYLPLVT